MSTDFLSGVIQGNKEEGLQYVPHFGYDLSKNLCTDGWVSGTATTYFPMREMTAFERARTLNWLLSAAIMEQDYEKVSAYLHAGADPQCPTISFSLELIGCPIRSASVRDNFEILKLLLDSGGSPHGSYGLQYQGIERARHSLGIEVDEKRDIPSGSLEQNPIRFAAGWDKPQCLQLLIQRGANVNQADRIGNTPLHASVRDSQSATCALILMDAGADIHAKNHREQSPRDLAAERNNHAILAAIDSALAMREALACIDELRHPKLNGARP